MNHRSLSIIACSITALASAPGCAVDVDDDTSAPTAEAVHYINNCGPWGCGANSPEMGAGISFHELDWTGLQVNDIGVRIAWSRMANGTALRLRVVGDELQGIKAATGEVVPKAQLVDATIGLVRGSDKYTLRIRRISEIPFWVRPLGPVETYTFDYREEKPNNDGWIPLCRGTNLGNEPEWQDREQIALIFQGDRYNAAAKQVTVTGAATATWFNVACAGSALAKLHLLRHTDAGAVGTYTTSVPQRRAMLKMFAADVCGRGVPFTRPGEPLFYMDSRGWYKFEPALASSIEAIWTDRGARCLDVPRRLVEEPTVLTRIQTECGGTLPPPCGPLLATWWRHGHVLSANP